MRLLGPECAKAVVVEVHTVLRVVADNHKLLTAETKTAFPTRRTTVDLLIESRLPEEEVRPLGEARQKVSRAPKSQWQRTRHHDFFAVVITDTSTP